MLRQSREHPAEQRAAGLGPAVCAGVALRRSARRPAFTLLEVLLALSIAVLLLGGLYVAMELQLRHADAGRQVVEESTLARSLLDRIAAEISLSLGPVQPQTTSSGQSSTSAAPTASSSGAGSTASSSSTATSSMSSTASSSTSNGVNEQVVFNLGLQGDNGQLTVYVSRWPREAILPPTDPNWATPPLVSDLRRVTWFMSDAGLAVQEIKIATADDSLSAPAPDINDSYSKLVAREVKAMQIDYYDPTQGWVESWDGTQPGDDGVTPIGPPAAVRITLVIAMPNPDGGGDLPSKQYVQVIPLHAANGVSASATGANTFNPNSSTSTGGTQP